MRASLSELSADEQRELTRLLEQEGVDCSQPQGIFRRDVQNSPLSYEQRRLWFLQQFSPESGLYNIPLVAWVKGPLQVEALQQAITEIVRRHEVLRTAFTEVQGSPVQVVHPALQIDLPVIELPSYGEGRRKEELKRSVREQLGGPFDLTRGDLLRVVLIRINVEEHVLVLNMHHIASDGWSLGVFTRELAALYEAFSQGLGSPLPELAIQYADYSAWQGEWLKGEVLEKQLASWKKQLMGATPLELPTDRPRPSMMSYRGASIDVTLSAELTEKLRDLSQHDGVTLFMCVLAAFQVLLYGFTGQRDISVGSPIAGRVQRETEQLIGCFVNTLVLRVDLRGNPSFRELLKRVKQVALDAYQNQGAPFEKLVEELQPERDMSRTPLFQVMFALQNTETADLRLPGLDLSQFDYAGDSSNGGTAKFDLELALVETGTGMRGELEYSTDLFDATTMTGMIECFQNLLQEIVQDPERSISQFRLMHEAEQRSSSPGWSGMETGNRQTKSFVNAVAERAAHTPQAVALTFEGLELTYGELNRRSNQLARNLKTVGVKSGTRVGVCLERSVDQVIAVLGTLKAGGTFVPLEPSEAPARLTFMFEDSGVQWVITEERLGNRFLRGSVQLLYLDPNVEEAEQESEEEPHAELNDDHLACVLYRSGKVGRPEGILIKLRTLDTVIFGTELDFTTSDRIGLTHSFCHESCFEIFRALATGASIILIPSGLQSAPRKFASLLRDHAVTVLFVSAALLQRVAREFPWALKSARLIVCQDKFKVMNRLRDTLGEGVIGRVFNSYGTSDVGGRILMWPLARMVKHANIVAMDHLGVGVKLYVLDNGCHPVPVDAVGEIHVGGETLAVGYNHQPVRSASTFVRDPFSEATQARLCRTGDLARRRRDGTLEFIGRHDLRMVIHGELVEPKEIEAVLLQHHAVCEAAVTVREVEGGRGSSMVALLVADEGQIITAEEVLHFLRERLPESMHPQKLIVVESLPRTWNGEVDQRAIEQTVEENDPASGSAPAYLAPRTPIEEQMVRIWARTLDIEQVGIHDNFFRLGGHSLLATQLVALMSDALKVDVPLRRLFEAPTIAELARIVELPALAGRIDKDSESLQQPMIHRAAREKRACNDEVQLDSRAQR